VGALIATLAAHPFPEEVVMTAWFPVGALVLCLSPFAVPASAQQPPQFAAPVRLLAGEKTLGEGRLYPSPMLHDVDGDGRLDVVTGDLRGRLTVALRTAGAAPACYAAEKPLQDEDGKDIDFHNW
jgi:hypothetical protein